MKIVVYLFCVLLSLRFVWNISCASKSKNADEFLRRLLSVSYDVVIIILFALIERGRW